MKLDHEAVMATIPHRTPMLLVDTVEDLEPGEHITATEAANSPPT